MPLIEIDDNVFEAAQRRASNEGYSSVNQYIADILVHDLVEDGGGEGRNLDHLFTPARLAEIDHAAADVESGNYFTAEQVREHFKQRRAAWAQKNAAR